MIPIVKRFLGENFGVAHALYHVSLSTGVQNNHSYDIFDPLFAYSLCHFNASTMTIKRCSKVSIPIVKRFLDENFVVAHALYHVTLGPGVQNNHSYEIFDPYLPIHCTTFMRLR